MTVACMVAHELGEDLETVTDVEEAEEEDLGFMIVLCTPRLSSVSGALCNTALWNSQVCARPPRYRATTRTSARCGGVFLINQQKSPDFQNNAVTTRFPVHLGGSSRGSIGRTNALQNSQHKISAFQNYFRYCGRHSSCSALLDTSIYSIFDLDFSVNKVFVVPLLQSSVHFREPRRYMTMELPCVAMKMRNKKSLKISTPI